MTCCPFNKSSTDVQSLLLSPADAVKRRSACSLCVIASGTETGTGGLRLSAAERRTENVFEDIFSHSHSIPARGRSCSVCATFERITSRIRC